MGEYFYLACKQCEEMIFLGKMSEKDPEKDAFVWRFLSEHMAHHLVLTGDSYNTDSDVIKFNDKNNPNTWDTKYKLIEYDKEKKADVKAKPGEFIPALVELVYCVKGGKAHIARRHENRGASIIYCPKHGILASITGRLCMSEKEVKKYYAHRQMTDAEYDRFVRNRFRRRK